MSLTPGLDRSASTDESALLEVCNASTTFATDRGSLRAVDDVSFVIKRGETLGIVGESGSGKTVLSRSILGLLPRSGVLQEGSIVFDGTEIVGAPDKLMRTIWGAKMAMVFQDPMASLNPVVRIGRQITESLRLHLDLDRSEAKATALSLLEQVGIPSPKERLRSYPFELSGGMRQRVMIAIALACSPKLLLADEPTTGLDVTVQAQILDLLSSLQKERHMSVILVSHDLGVVASRTDNIAVMYAGKVVEIAPTATLFSSMAMPYTKALVDSTPRLSQPSHLRLSPIEGRPPDMTTARQGCAFAPRCSFATDRCRSETPPLVTSPSNPLHRFACWNPLNSISIGESS